MYPEISVIMAVYNEMPLGPQSKTRIASSTYLKQAVDSILSQSYKNFEFIIIDDCSTDNSLKTLESYKDERIKIIRNKKNMGLAASLNKALKQVKGEYIARMDADDLSNKKRFAVQLKFLKKNPSIDLCGSWAEIINENNEVVGKLTYKTKAKHIKQILPLYNPLIHPSIMARKNFFETSKGYDPNFDIAEDYEIFMRMKDKANYANVDKFLIQLRISKTRRSARSMKKMSLMDFRIKLKYLEPLNPTSIFGFVKQIITTFLIPEQIKLNIARAFKRT